MRAWLVFAGVGLPASLVVGWVYAHAMAWTASKPFDILFAVLGLAVAAIVVSAVAEAARSRSVRLNGAFGALMGFAVVWFHWIVTLKLHGQPALAAQFLGSGPRGWWEVLGGLLSRFSASGGSAWPVAAAWLLEAGLFVTLARWMAVGSAEQAFSEPLGRWAKPAFKGELYAWGESWQALQRRLVDEGPAALQSMIPAAALRATSIASEWWTLQIEAQSVEADPLARWLDLTLLVHTRDDGGRIKVRRQPVLRRWHVKEADFEALQAHLSAPPEALKLPSEHANDDAAEGTPPELQPAVTALEGGDWAAAVTWAEGFIQHPQAHVRQDALRLCGLALARQGQWDASFQRYHALFDTEPSAFVALQLATTSICAGQLLRGEAWFRRAHEINDEAREMPPPRLDTAYLSALEQAGEVDATLPLLDKLANGYRALGTSDDHLLWSHGLPFLGEFLQKSLPLQRASRPDEEVRRWYRGLRTDLDAEGQDRIDAFLKDAGLGPTTSAQQAD